MSGTVGIVASDTGRYTLFSVALTQMEHPPNTKLDWAISTDIAGARNTIVQRALDAGSEWVFFMSIYADYAQAAGDDPAMHLLGMSAGRW